MCVWFHCGLFFLDSYVELQRKINLKRPSPSARRDELDEEMKADTECEYEKSAAEFIETWMKGLGQISGSAEQCEGRKLDMMFRWDRTHITKASGFERTRDFSRWNYSSHISYVLQLKL